MYYNSVRAGRPTAGPSQGDALLEADRSGIERRNKRGAKELAGGGLWRAEREGRVIGEARSVVSRVLVGTVLGCRSMWVLVLVRAVCLQIMLASSQGWQPRLW